MRRKTVGAVVVAVALGATGCGGDKPLTHAELVKQAVTICKRMQSEAGRVFRHARRGNQAQTRAELGAVVKRGTDDLDGLKPPSADSARFDGYVKALRTQLASITSTTRSTTASQRRQQQASEAAKRYKEEIGLSRCI
jgi:hypothetical protein